MVTLNSTSIVLQIQKVITKRANPIGDFTAATHLAWHQWNNGIHNGSGNVMFQWHMCN